MNVRKASLFPAVLLFFLCSPLGLWAQAESYSGEVVGVSDGDTITVLTTDFERIKVRFYGIDCPEKGQPYGNEAKDHLYKAIYGKKVDVLVKDVDRYSRYVGIVSIGGKSVNDEMVASGLAWTYTSYCKDEGICSKFRASESSAKGAKRGLWQDPGAIPPWDWRRNKR
ncbi:MAG: thermonuclease family protein [Deltaproteobacteria bacterium]|jgi:endonuclease YncB( thermonuclease family)|nr:thermonuclease family protein [Deltaproteobacteria bacterium]